MYRRSGNCGDDQRQADAREDNGADHRRGHRRVGRAELRGLVDRLEESREARVHKGEEPRDLKMRYIK